MTSPLTPLDCDLTDFPFMPLEVARLRRSKAWLICKRTPALAFYMLNLWTACWHERPAGSLEDDDDVLADFAMCDPAKWPKVKVDALRGWVLCDDGRYYHPVVCEKVVEAWNAKLDQRWRTECGRIKKHNDRHHTSIPRPSFDEWVVAGCPQGQRLPVPRDTTGTGEGHDGETHSKGEGEGEGEGQGQGQGQGEMDSGAKAPDGAGAPSSSKKPKTPEEKAKAEVWRAAVSVLEQGGCPNEAQARTFMGKLVGDYTFPIVKEAVAAAVTEQPAEAREYLKATCQRLKGERKDPTTVAENPQVAETAARLSAEAARDTQVDPERIQALKDIKNAVKVAGVLSTLNTEEEPHAID